jgi:hypothetical protein
MSMNYERQPWRGGQWQQYWPEQPGAKGATANEQPQQGATPAARTDELDGRARESGENQAE